MKVPSVAIVGRPNVGKSTLLNLLAKRKISIVEKTPGVTRDRVSTLVRFKDRLFEAVDTGGIGAQDIKEFSSQIKNQIEIALSSADVIIFIVDVTSGIVSQDQEIANILRRHDTPVILVANKCDTKKRELGKSEFYKLGITEPLAMSALLGIGKTRLLEEIAKLLSACDVEVSKPIMKIAIVGKRNVGKSTFVNVLAKEERVIVSEVPGTTRDSIDVRFQKNGKEFVAIDTAGVRKKRKIQNSIEFFSIARTERSIRRADMVLLLLDVTSEISSPDKKIANYIISQYKPCIIVVNKWDLAKAKITTAEFARYAYDKFRGLSFAPMVFTTATFGKNTLSSISLAQSLFKQANTKITTAHINFAIKEAIRIKAPPRKGNVQGKTYYGTQIGVNPIRILLFVNRTSLFTKGYQRYLVNRFREAFSIPEVPIKLSFKGHKRLTK